MKPIHDRELRRVCAGRHLTNDWLMLYDRDRRWLLGWFTILFRCSLIHTDSIHHNDRRFFLLLLGLKSGIFSRFIQDHLIPVPVFFIDIHNFMETPGNRAIKPIRAIGHQNLHSLVLQAHAIFVSESRIDRISQMNGSFPQIFRKIGKNIFFLLWFFLYP